VLPGQAAVVSSRDVVGVREGVLADVVGLLGGEAEHAEQVFGHLIGGRRVVAIGVVVH
jgi:hypothetical protein